MPLKWVDSPRGGGLAMLGRVRVEAEALGRFGGCTGMYRDSARMMGVLRALFPSGVLRPSMLFVCGLIVGQAAAETVKIGFIGLRHGHSWRQLRDVTDIAEANFVGVAESIPELVEAAREIQPDAHFSADYREFVAAREPDVVWAFVENDRHLEIVEFLAPLGIHVIFEKPLAGTYSDAVRIGEMAREHGIKVMTNYQMAWWASNHALRRLASEGKIGRPWRLHGIVGNGGPSPRDFQRKVFFEWLTDPERNGAGALVDFGIYNAVWAVWHLGLPRSVSATVHRLQPDRFPNVDDNAVLVLSYPNAVGVFEASWNLPRGFQQLEILGTTGSLAMNRQQLTHQAKGKRPVQVDLAQLDEVASHPVRYMIDRVTSGKPLGHIVALDLNIAAVQVLEAAKLSARDKRSVALPLETP